MVLKRAETQLKVMLADTILALCRNALPFRGKVAVEGLLGVTLDDEEIFLVNINEIIRKECLETNQEIRKDITASSSSSPGKRETSGSEEGSSDEDSKGSPAKRRRKRKRRKSSGNSQKEDQTAVKREGEGEEEDVEDDDLVFVKSEPVEQSYGQDYSHDNSSLGANFSAQSEGVYHPGEGGSQSGDFSQIFTDGGQSAGLDHLQQLALQMSSGNVQPGLQGESQASTSQGDGALPGKSIKGPKKCGYCSKTFSCVRHLLRHERTHTGEKPFQCDWCGMSFSQSGNMYRHIRRIHFDEAMFPCDFCNIIFAQKSNLQVHMRRHLEGNQHYTCDICYTNLTSKRNLKSHKESVHFVYDTEEETVNSGREAKSQRSKSGQNKKNKSSSKHINELISSKMIMISPRKANLLQDEKDGDFEEKDER